MLARFNGNVVPFADDATSTNRTVFGGTTQSDTLDDNLNASYKTGWETVGLNDNPTREDFNAMGYTLGALTSYLYEMGIAEWNASQNYRIGSVTIGSDGELYKSLTGTISSPNINHNPITDTTNWKCLNKNLSYKSTPISITSWSYSGTTITLNVASHSFIAGDYIEVTGLTATTYPANGIHLVTSVTSTTIVFTLGATPTGTAGVSSAAVKGYVTINGRVSESIGVNQTWQNVTRVSNTTYTNTTGKPILIIINIASTQAISGTLTVNGLVVDSQYYNYGSGNAMSLEAIIPNGSTYSYIAAGTGLAIGVLELR